MKYKLTLKNIYLFLKPTLIVVGLVLFFILPPKFAVCGLIALALVPLYSLGKDNLKYEGDKHD